MADNSKSLVLRFAMGAVLPFALMAAVAAMFVIGGHASDAHLGVIAYGIGALLTMFIGHLFSRSGGIVGKVLGGLLMLIGFAFLVIVTLVFGGFIK